MKKTLIVKFFLFDFESLIFQSQYNNFNSFGM